ncbi:MAG: hypothetical protein ACJAVM_003398 [Sulfitobacter sp.]|jgi:Uncharacterized protein conserved in bacteria (DUF2334)
MTVDWSPLAKEMMLWRRAARPLPLWWRDDDAVEITPALSRLVTLAEALSLPVHLAVIPKFAQPALADVTAQGWAIPMVHGWAHINHAPKGQKKAEFGHPRAQARADITAGLACLRGVFGDALLEVFVPPWNRIDRGILEELPALGFTGLSTYTPRKQRCVANGLVQINTHMDPIFWRGGGGLRPADQQINALVTLLQNRRTGNSDASEPLGFLTHHLVHDPAIWDFSHDCLARLLDGGAIPCNLKTLGAALP